MTASLRVVLNKQNIRQMLRSQELAAAITPYGVKIKARADAGSGDDGHEVKVFTGHDRTSVLVVAVSYDARRAEQETRNLTRAMEAARE